MHDLGPATRELRRIVERIDDTRLGDATPCAEWSVRDLALHLLTATAHFVTVARKQPGLHDPADALPDDWRALLAAQLDELAAAWRDPDAWTGDGEAGGVRMPNADLGVVALEEVVLHGWDLATVLGEPFSVTDDDVVAVEGFVEGFADASQQQRAGLYGPVVDMPIDATRFDRVLVLAGRDPQAATRLPDRAPT